MRTLDTEIKKKIRREFLESKGESLYISKQMLQDINGLCVDGKVDEFFQNLYLTEIAKAFDSKRLPHEFNEKEELQLWISLVRNTLQFIDDKVIFASKIKGFYKHILYGFKKAGELKPKHLIYKDILNESKDDIYAINSQGKIIAKLSQIEIEMNIFKTFNNNIKIFGKFDTFLDFSQYDVYFENDLGLKISISLSNRNYETKIFGKIVVNSPFSFLTAYILPKDFLNKEVFLIAQHKKFGTIVKLNLNFVGNSARLIKGVTDSHLLIGDKAVFYNDQDKVLKITMNVNRINYQRQLANSQLSGKLSKMWNVLLLVFIYLWGRRLLEEVGK